MGGDHGPDVVIPALMTVATRRPDIRFIIYGLEDQVRPELAKFPQLAEKSEFVHCEIAVKMDEKPSAALRHGRWKSSMWKAIEAVKSDTSDACVSAGNTGALMAMSKFCLRTMASIDRPAIAAIWPTLRSESVVLDVGATIGADSHQLVDFAILGAAMARSVFGIDRPTVGLLNVGVEEVKGQEEVKDAGRMLREADLGSMTYRGFVASPVQGVPQGLAVYQNGVRINEAFGDVVNFDLIPPQAIQRIDVVTGNPVFGLNAIGGAVNIQMKNGFTWQGTEISAWGGSDARTAGYLEYGKISGPWSFYFTGDGLNDRGWRYQNPSTIGRLYADLGYRSQDSEFHLIGLAARSFYGAAAATPVDLTHLDPRAIFT